jgi:hypothetical protein
MIFLDLYDGSPPKIEQSGVELHCCMKMDMVMEG